MTVTATPRKAGPYAGNGVTTTFAFTFQVLNADHLLATRTSSVGVEGALVLNDDYTVALNEDQTSNPGGTVTLLANDGVTPLALPTGEKLTITSDEPEDQDTTFSIGGGFSPATLTARLDKLTRLVQQHTEKLGRALLAAVSDGSDPWAGIGAAAARAGKYLYFNAVTGAAEAAAIVTTGITLTQSVIGELLNPQTAAEAAAGATIINYWIPNHEQCGYVSPHRYGNNTTPGTTDFYSAIATAINVAERTADADGVNCPVRLRGERYGFNTQIVLKHGVSLLGAGDRSTTLEPLSAFANITTTGAVRLGNGTAPTFGCVLADVLLQMNSLAGSIGVYSSDIQAGGCYRVTVNNFVAGGFVFDGAGGSFGSVNGFSLEHCQAFKANTGGTSGIGVKIKDGTFPAHVHTVQVYGNAANPLSKGYEITNFPFVATNCNVDGAGTTGIDLVSGAIAVVNGFKSLGWTNVVNIAMSGQAALIGIDRTGGTNTIVDAGNGSGVAKTITATAVGLYVRGSSPTTLEALDVYGQVRMAGVLNIDKIGAFGTARLRAFVGDGTGGTVADEAYFRGLNTDIHFWSGAAGTTPVLRLRNGIGPHVPSYTVAGVPSASVAGGIIYISNEAGGAVLAFSDGTNWRRVTDRAIVS